MRAGVGQQGSISNSAREHHNIIFLFFSLVGLIFSTSRSITPRECTIQLGLEDGCRKESGRMHSPYLPVSGPWPAFAGTFAAPPLYLLADEARHT